MRSAGQSLSCWGMAFAGLVPIMAPTMLVYTFLQQYLTKVLLGTQEVERAAIGDDENDGTANGSGRNLSR